MPVCEVEHMLRMAYKPGSFGIDGLTKMVRWLESGLRMPLRIVERFEEEK